MLSQNSSDVIAHLSTRYTTQWRIHEYISIAIVTIFVPFIFCGNIMVVLSVSKYKRLQIPTNYFITSLAAADIFIACVLPFYVVSELTDVKVHNDYVCLASNRLLMTAGGVSIATLAVIAYDRYTAILHPLVYKCLMTGQKTAFLVTSSWIYSALISWLPMFVGWHGNIENHASLCSNNILDRKAHILFISAIFAPACFCILICYFRIFLIARHHAIAITTVQLSLKQNLEQQFVRRDTKYAKTLAVVIGVFLFLWLPYLVCLLVEIVNCIHINTWLKSYLMILAFLNSGVNPWVYAHQNNEFRAAYKKISKSLKCCWCPYQGTDRRSSLVSTISILPGSSGTMRLNQADIRVTTSDLLYLLSRRVGNDKVDNALAQTLDTRLLGAVNDDCSLKELLKIYIQSNPGQVLSILEEVIKNESNLEDSGDSAFSMTEFPSEASTDSHCNSTEVERNFTHKKNHVEVCMHATSSV